jgi:hypothetical protein
MTGRRLRWRSTKRGNWQRSAARDLAEHSGREVVVHDDPDDAESRADGGDQAPSDRGGRIGAPDIGVPDDETPREPQAGL